MENLWKSLLIISMLGGCTTLTPLEKEERDYRRIDEITQRQYEWHACIADRGYLFLRNHSQHYRLGIENTPPRQVKIYDARTTYCVKRGYF